ncbi:MAG: RelA/SpoT family protein [Patescibacteria group bacterium]
MKPLIKKIQISQITIDDVIEKVQEYEPDADTDLLMLAYEFAEEAHRGQKRASGDPYIIHSLHTAYNLARLKMDVTMVIAGILHDVPEDTERTFEDVEKNFGREITHLVQGVTKLGTLKYRGLERYAENLRKMFLAMADDIRVIFIKFADRLHNLQTLQFLPPEKQRRIALESLEIYAAIANRLGMNEIRHQLEDASFRVLSPKEYDWVISLRKEPERILLKNLENIKKRILKELHLHDIETFVVVGRQKMVYSLYKKLLRKNRDINNIYDVIALRIIVPSIADCYKSMGVLHSIWRPMPGRIKDYISVPKPNGYKSLHTTVFADNGQIVEIQIRTQEMHEQAEYGVAAHWHYKRSGSIQLPPEQKKWIEELAHIQKRTGATEEYLKEIKLDFFTDRIFIFTPRGDVIELPEEATPVDFAYHVHTYLGNHCGGAKINDNIAGLDTHLQSGDVVEIIVDKNRKSPSKDWLDFVKTRSARDHIKTAIRKSSRGIFNFPGFNKS